ncbi:MAG: BadF/BadG/BcrA/BcrD ATPase family protein [Chloroflexota bacterium]
MIYLGLDGGGSTVRMGAYAEDMSAVGEVTHRNSVNPSTIGREPATARIHAAIRELLDNTGLSVGDIDAIGVGISGADTGHSREWLLQTLAVVLPGVAVTASGDYEIALVAAHGERYGTLILSGTGSVAYGVNRAGRGHRVGGWGYYIGDEGSGYWLGMMALRHLAHVADGRAESSLLAEQVRMATGIDRAMDELIGWVYHSGGPRNQDMARLASVVLDCAEKGDAVARKLIAQAADDLYAHYTALVSTLDLEDAPIGFAGGLLSSVNPLSGRLMQLLGMDVLPQPMHSPTGGAALLAKIALEKNADGD